MSLNILFSFSEISSIKMGKRKTLGSCVGFFFPLQSNFPFESWFIHVYNSGMINYLYRKCSDTAWASNRYISIFIFLIWVSFLRALFSLFILFLISWYFEKFTLTKYLYTSFLLLKCRVNSGLLEFSVLLVLNSFHACFVHWHSN